MEEQLLEFTAKALNISKDEVKEILEDESNGGLETLVQKDAARIKSIKDTGYKSAERKINGQWESKLVSTFGLQSDTKGPELIDEVKEVVETKIAEVKPAKEITEVQIKKHPEFLKLEKQLQESETTFDEKLKKLVAEKEEAFQQERLFVDVKSTGLQLFESLKPDLSQDPERAANQKKIFLRELENYKYQKEGNELILLDRETGERLNNEQGYPKKFEDLVRSITTSYFDLQASEPRASSGRKPDESTTMPTVQVPKTREEYTKYLDSDADPAEKTKVMELYNAQS